MHRKYIITGAPGTGKSTLIEALENKGFPCIKEVSRKVIKSEQDNGNNGMPWKNIERFTSLVFTNTKKALLDNSQSQFCDRSLVDNLAYLKYYNKDTPNYLKRFNYNTHYHNIVFFAPQWEEIYTTDNQRPEGFEAQTKLSKQIEKTYLDMGFTLIYIPLVSVKERTEFILKHTNKKIVTSS